MQDLFGLTGKRAIILGGGAGMGESTARLLAQLGCAVAVVDRDPVRADAVTAGILRHGGKASAVAGDILGEAAPASLLAAAVQGLGGPLDILVSVVGGVVAKKSLLTMTAAEWDADQHLNLRSFFLAAQTFAAELSAARRSGVVTCVASVSGIQGAPAHGAYGAAKAGLMQLVRTMAVEWAPHGIRVNAVAPGSIVTPRLPDTDAHRARIAGSLIPMRRRGTVDEIAKAVLFLSSDLSSYVNGHTLLVDGGWMSSFLLASAPDHAAP